MQYLNPLKQTNQQVGGQSYQLINFNSVVDFLWTTQVIQDPTIQWFIASQNELNGYVEDGIITLPPAGQGTVGATFTLQNISAYDIEVRAHDGTSLMTLSSLSDVVKFTLISQSAPLGFQNWKFYVQGTVTNTNTLSQNLGLTLRQIGSTNKIQTAATVNPITVLPYNVIGGYYGFTADTIATYSGTIIKNPSTSTVQKNILLPTSQSAYALAGFSMTFVNEGANPLVLQTQGDTINGVPLDTITNSASFVIVPGASVTLSSSSSMDWVIVDQSSQYQNVFKTANLNLTSASYVYLKQGATYQNRVTTFVEESVGVAVAIDMSSNLDLVFSPIWYLNGAIPQTIQDFMVARGQDTVWILLPNNLSYVYFIQGRSSPAFKVGLGCRFNETQVAIAPVFNAYPMGSAVTLPFQYSAQINTANPNVSTQFVSALLLSGSNSGGGSGASYPDITDENGIVQITGPYGLTSLFGPISASELLVGSSPVLTRVLSPIAGDFVMTDDSGNVTDSQIKPSTDTVLGGGNPSNFLLPTQAAVSSYISKIMSSGFVVQSAYNATTNIPPLVQGVGTSGYAYPVTVGGTQQLLDPSVYPNSGTYDFVPGDLIFFGANGQYGVIPFNNSVISVNGMAGYVTLGMADLSDTFIRGPSQGQVVTYNATAGKWQNQAPSIPGITANGFNLTFTVQSIFNTLTTFQGETKYLGQVTYGTENPASQNPPRYVGSYPTNFDGTELVTLDLLVERTIYPNMQDNLTTNQISITGDGGLAITSGPLVLPSKTTANINIEMPVTPTSTKEILNILFRGTGTTTQYRGRLWGTQSGANAPIMVLDVATTNTTANIMVTPTSASLVGGTSATTASGVYVQDGVAPYVVRGPSVDKSSTNTIATTGDLAALQAQITNLQNTVNTLSNTIIGISQNWVTYIQNPDRQFNTVYRNSTTRPIMCFIYGGTSTGGQKAEFNVYINGVPLAPANFDGGFGQTVSFIVSPNSTYELRTTSATFLVWSELR